MKMNPKLRFVESVGLKLVKLGVFLLLDLARLAHPQGVHHVYFLTIQVDWKRDETGIAFDDTLESVFSREFLVFLL